MDWFGWCRTLKTLKTVYFNSCRDSILYATGAVANNIHLKHHLNSILWGFETSVSNLRKKEPENRRLAGESASQPCSILETRLLLSVRARVCHVIPERQTLPSLAGTSYLWLWPWEVVCFGFCYWEKLNRVVIEVTPQVRPTRIWTHRKIRSGIKVQLRWARRRDQRRLCY